MKKMFLATSIVTALLMFSGCSKSETVVNTEVVTVESGQIAKNIEVGKTIQDNTFTDQFEKQHQVSETTQKVIFAFKKDMGHIVTELLKSKPNDYLSSKETLFVADMSKMPSLIYKFAVLPDLEDLAYPILTILDEEKAAGYMNDKEVDRIMIVSLDNSIVKHVTFVATTEDLVKEIE